ncbi:hypothetical protein [Mycolicibacterium phocaicum]|uniref:Uncharacterized protein n=1 Tax=Mycolicibacterium phocaicum TaxID=319706 RepID=A0AA94RGI5_9MYCO|nr:hypothetical protein [Mycolicibacterium phocaicum]TLH72866.1 hypothetical protein C1S79_04680 [Mycolicibacterium phocaicum]
MSTAKLWGLVSAFTLGLLVVLAGLSFAFNGWFAHLLTTSGSALETAVLVGVVAVPCFVIAATAAFAIEKPLDQTL